MTKRAERTSDALSHHFFSPVGAQDLVLVEGTAPAIRWSRPRSEGSGPGPPSHIPPWCQNLARHLYVGSVLPG